MPIKYGTSIAHTDMTLILFNQGECTMKLLNLKDFFPAFPKRQKLIFKKWKLGQIPKKYMASIANTDTIPILFNQGESIISLLNLNEFSQPLSIKFIFFSR